MGSKRERESKWGFKILLKHMILLELELKSPTEFKKYYNVVILYIPKLSFVCKNTSGTKWKLWSIARVWTLQMQVRRRVSISINKHKNCELKEENQEISCNNCHSIVGKKKHSKESSIQNTEHNSSRNEILSNFCQRN